MRALAALASLGLVSLLSLGGCAGGQRQASAVDTAAITLAVDGVIKAFNTALAARDTTAIDSLYADDAELLPANMPRLEGREAIHRWWAEGLSAPGLQLVLVPTRTTVAQAGDLAMVVGTYDYRAAGPKGEVLREVGKFVNILKPSHDRWQIVTDIWNSDASPSAPAK